MLLLTKLLSLFNKKQKKQIQPCVTTVSHGKYCSINQSVNYTILEAETYVKYPNEVLEPPRVSKTMLPVKDCETEPRLTPQQSIFILKEKKSNLHYPRLILITLY